MTQLRLLVGLGNPGPKYDKTRHNAGFWFVDRVAGLYGVDWQPLGKFKAEGGRFRWRGDWVYLLKPQTYMNLSGRAVAPLCRFYKIPPEAILVAHDELDFPPGMVRLKRNGGHGGHNGLKDIIDKLGSRNFLRLRIGIGHPGRKEFVPSYVLSPPSEKEHLEIEAAIERAVEILPILLDEGLQAAMNRLHAVP